MLNKDRSYFTIHYTGGGLWLDPNDTVEEARSIQAYAAGPAKGTPWEYNYIVDGQGNVVEYAGDYTAAHSAGENTDAIGVLLLVGYKGKYPDVEYWEYPTAAMIMAVQELRQLLLSRKMLSPSHTMRPHKLMPGAATVCPGPAVMTCWDDLIRTPKPPTPIGDDDMQVRLLILSDSDAQFLAMTDNQGQALYVTWAGPGSPEVDAAVAAHRAEANRKGYGKQFEQKGNLAGIFNCVLVGELPYGDSQHNWSGAEFWKVG
jgi:hypothetical protein